MHFTDLIRTVNCVNDPYRSYGSTNRYDIFDQIYSSPTNEIQFSDRIQTEKCLFYDQ